MNEKQAIALLKKYSTDEERFGRILAHSKKVQEIALRIADEIPDADKEFIKIASLLHDIGRFKCPPGKDSIKHGIEGAKILRKENLPEKFALVAERHIGVGISKEDIKKQKLDLPLKDYLPETVEEKIIAHADNLAFGSREGTLNEVIERFRKELGEEYVKRVEKLAEEIEKSRIWKKQLKN